MIGSIPSRRPSPAQTPADDARARGRGAAAAARPVRRRRSSSPCSQARSAVAGRVSPLASRIAPTRRRGSRAGVAEAEVDHAGAVQQQHDAEPADASPATSEARSKSRDVMRPPAARVPVERVSSPRRCRAVVEGRRPSCPSSSSIASWTTWSAPMPMSPSITSALARRRLRRALAPVDVEARRCRGRTPARSRRRPARRRPRTRPRARARRMRRCRARARAACGPRGRSTSRRSTRSSPDAELVAVAQLGERSSGR